MSLAIVHSRASAGINAPLVIVEVHLSKGLPGLSISGLPETAVKESRHRVRSAIVNSQLEFPVSRITVNLAPADLPKEGGRFDLAIALGILAASGQIPGEALHSYEFAGELALSGLLRPITGALPFAMATKKENRQLIITAANWEEATLLENVPIFAAQHLLEVCAHLRGVTPLSPLFSRDRRTSSTRYPDLQDVIGQVHGKRALEIAAAGGHSLLFVGPPGTGKTMLATRLPGILPPLSVDEALEVAAVYSMGHQGFHYEQWGVRPFRAPHHTVSAAAMVGGSTPPRPGEISLAHSGVLFLDELPEFDRHVLESLREPLEAGWITISRAAHQARFPSRFQLMAAMNPCPCGYLGDVRQHCRCTREQVQRYHARLSGPLLDRIDMHIEIPPVSASLLLNSTHERGEGSGFVRQRVIVAREKQWQRAAKLNTSLLGEEIEHHCTLSSLTKQFLEETMTKWHWSARAYHRILKLARTIADLDDQATIQPDHLREALSYRCLEKAVRSFE